MAQPELKVTTCARDGRKHAQPQAFSVPASAPPPPPPPKRDPYQGFADDESTRRTASTPLKFLQQQQQQQQQPAAKARPGHSLADALTRQQQDDRGGRSGVTTGQSDAQATSSSPSDGQPSGRDHLQNTGNTGSTGRQPTGVRHSGVRGEHRHSASELNSSSIERAAEKGSAEAPAAAAAAAAASLLAPPAFTGKVGGGKADAQGGGSHGKGGSGGISGRMDHTQHSNDSDGKGGSGGISGKRDHTQHSSDSDGGGGERRDQMQHSSDSDGGGGDDRRRDETQHGSDSERGASECGGAEVVGAGRGPASQAGQAAAVPVQAAALPEQKAAVPAVPDVPLSATGQSRREIFHRKARLAAQLQRMGLPPQVESYGSSSLMVGKIIPPGSDLDQIRDQLQLPAPGVGVRTKTAALHKGGRSAWQQQQQQQEQQKRVHRGRPMSGRLQQEKEKKELQEEEELRAQRHKFLQEQQQQSQGGRSAVSGMIQEPVHAWRQDWEARKRRAATNGPIIQRARKLKAQMARDAVRRRGEVSDLAAEYEAAHQEMQKVTEEPMAALDGFSHTLLQSMHTPDPHLAHNRVTVPNNEVEGGSRAGTRPAGVNLEAWQRAHDRLNAFKREQAQKQKRCASQSKKTDREEHLERLTVLLAAVQKEGSLLGVDVPSNHPQPQQHHPKSTPQKSPSSSSNDTPEEPNKPADPPTHHTGRPLDPHTTTITLTSAHEQPSEPSRLRSSSIKHTDSDAEPSDHDSSFSFPNPGQQQQQQQQKSSAPASNEQAHTVQSAASLRQRQQQLQQQRQHRPPDSDESEPEHSPPASLRGPHTRQARAPHTLPLQQHTRLTSRERPLHSTPHSLPASFTSRERPLHSAPMHGSGGGEGGAPPGRSRGAERGGSRDHSGAYNGYNSGYNGGVILPQHGPAASHRVHKMPGMGTSKQANPSVVYYPVRQKRAKASAVPDQQGAGHANGLASRRTGNEVGGRVRVGGKEQQQRHQQGQKLERAGSGRSSRSAGSQPEKQQQQQQQQRQLQQRHGSGLVDLLPEGDHKGHHRHHHHRRRHHLPHHKQEELQQQQGQLSAPVSLAHVPDLVCKGATGDGAGLSPQGVHISRFADASDGSVDLETVGSSSSDEWGVHDEAGHTTYSSQQRGEPSRTLSQHTQPSAPHEDLQKHLEQQKRDRSPASSSIITRHQQMSALKTCGAGAGAAAADDDGESSTGSWGIEPEAGPKELTMPSEEQHAIDPGAPEKDASQLTPSLQDLIFQRGLVDTTYEPPRDADIPPIRFSPVPNWLVRPIDDLPPRYR